jgi:SulP family sulfate permease
VALIEAVPASLPSPHIPEVRLSWLGDLAPSSFALAMLGILEALAIAKAIAQKSGQKLDFNQQILAEGLGNLTGAFFRCMPGSGSLSRTAINHQAGAVTRASGLICALAIGFAVLALGPLAAYIPKPVLSGLLIVASARLIDLSRIRYALSSSRYDAFLASVTAVAALAIGVEFAIFIGALLSVLLYVPRAAQLKVQELVVSPERVLRARLPSDPPPRAVTVHDIEGELFFAAAPVLTAALEQAARAAKAQGIDYMVLRLKRVRNTDAVALEALDRFLEQSRASGLTVLLAGLRPDILNALTGFGIVERHSIDLIFPEEERDYSSTLSAVRRAYALATQQALRRGEQAPPDQKPRYYLV